MKRAIAWFRARIGNPTALVTAACFFYLAHVFFQGKTACSEIAAGFALICLYFALRERQLPFSFHILDYPLFLYAAVSTISALVSDRRIHMAGEAMLWVKIAVFPTALILLRSVPNMPRLTLNMHAVFTTWISLDGLLQYFFENQRDLEHRITGTSTHVMTYSGFLLPLSLLFGILWLHQRKQWMLIPAGLASFALLLTFTRSAWLAWVAAVLALLFAVRPRSLAYAVPALVIFVLLMPLPMFSRLASTFDTRQESNLDRIRMVQAGVEIIKDYPLFGVGPANVKEIYPLYRKADAPRFRIPHLHNNIVQIWAERGIVALTAYLLLIGLFVRECARGWRGPGRAWAQAGVAIAVSLAVAGMFEFNFGDTEVFYLMLDLFALTIVGLEQAA